MISEHFDALKARLEADAGLAGKVYDTVRLDVSGGLVREQYVILRRTGPESITSDRLAKVPMVDSVLEFYIDVRAVGTTPTACGAVADRILTQFAGHRLVIAGRSCAPLVVDDVSPVMEDTSIKPFLYYADLAFELVSEPA